MKLFGQLHLQPRLLLGFSDRRRLYRFPVIDKTAWDGPTVGRIFPFNQHQGALGLVLSARWTTSTFWTPSPSAAATSAVTRTGSDEVGTAGEWRIDATAGRPAHADHAAAVCRGQRQPIGLLAGSAGQPLRPAVDHSQCGCPQRRGGAERHSLVGRD